MYIFFRIDMKHVDYQTVRLLLVLFKQELVLGRQVCTGSTEENCCRLKTNLVMCTQKHCALHFAEITNRVTVSKKRNPQQVQP